MTLNEALRVLANYYGVAAENGIVSGISTTLPDHTPHEVWQSWQMVLNRIRTTDDE